MDKASLNRSARLGAIRKRLSAWYTEHQRPLPWRATRDPYAILVSEIMLQQTQVERVIARYHDFLTRFPSFEALASASRGDVIRAWAPLGYNLRAVRLHQVARIVVEQHGGRLPDDPELLAGLAGLGFYTSAAVACFAFGRQVAAIDTNVRRVITRLFADQFATVPPSGRAVAAMATSALPAGRAADWNQALMDLGATICTARAPSCSRCPLAGLCPSRQHHLRPGGERPDNGLVTARKSQPRSPRSGLRAAEPQAAYRAEDSFVGSSRYYRGRIVERLRAVPLKGSLGLAELGRAVRADFSPAEQDWLLELLERLAAEGLVQLERGEAANHSPGVVRVRLP